MKKLVLLAVLALTLGLAACAESLPNFDTPELNVPEVPAGLVQGVTETTVKVGNTVAVSGAFSEVGGPFVAAMHAVFNAVNANGGINGRTVEFITYDDGGLAENGLSLTRRLVEEDQVFAMVGHFGTWTVGATLPYLLEKHIPMLYAATGINNLYFQETPGNPIMAVQPIYRTDGRIAFARITNEALFGPNKNQVLPADAKIGVLYTNDDAGKSIAAGVIQEAKAAGLDKNLVMQQFSSETYQTSAQRMLDNNVQAIIIAANQNPFKDMAVALNDVGNTAPVFTSYVSANVAAVTDLPYTFDIYANAWIDIVDPEGDFGFSAEYWAFYWTMVNAGYPQYAANAFAIAGYVAANMFVESFGRLEGEVTFAKFIEAVESAPVSIPMGGTVDFSDGKRWGIAEMSLLKYSPTQGETAPAFTKVREIEALTAIQAKR